MPRYSVTIDDREFDVEIEPGSGTITARVNGKEVGVQSHTLSETRSLLMVNDKSFEVDIRSNGINGNKKVFMTGCEVSANIEDYNLAQLRKTAGFAAASAAETVLKAPMPGLVVKVRVSEGEKVKKGAPLIVIEAMKMENIIKAKSDVTVKTVNVEGGQAVEKGDKLLEFE